MKAKKKFLKLINFIVARYAPRGAHLSYSAAGEDVVMHTILAHKNPKDIFYIDIGAHHPVFGNNTYLFYRKGGRGVLVEPNDEYCKKIKKYRPRDSALAVGVGAKEGMVDFHAFKRTTRSTFSHEQALAWEHESGEVSVSEKKKIITLNTIIRDHCKGVAPDIVSIDAEGLDMEIISSFNWSVKPKIFCIESADQIQSFLEEKGYELKAKIFYNSIFVLKSI